MKIVVCNLQYKIDGEASFNDFEDYNDDKNGELIIPYYDKITTKQDELEGKAKKKIKVYFKLEGPSANILPVGVPTWSGATVDAGNALLASTELTEAGTTTIETLFNPTSKISAKVHVIKIVFAEGATNKYGFDEPYANHPNDFQFYLSVDKTQETSIKVNISPKPNGLTFYAKTLDATKFKIGDAEKKEINSGAESIIIKGMTPVGDKTSSPIRIYVEHSKDQAKNYIFQDMVSVLLYKEKIINDWYIYRLKATVAANDIAVAMTDNGMKDYANGIVKSAVMKFNNVHISPQTVIDYDTNGNEALDWYYDGGNQPEHSIIAGNNGVIGDPKIAIVAKINFAWRTNVAVVAGANSVTLQGSSYLSSWLNQTYTFGVGADAEDVIITNIVGNTVTFSTPLVKSHPAGTDIFKAGRGVSANPQIVVDSNPESTCVHETLHRPNIGTLLDIGERVENIMYYTYNANRSKLRQRSQKLYYNNPGGNRENQWDKIPR